LVAVAVVAVFPVVVVVFAAAASVAVESVVGRGWLRPESRLEARALVAPCLENVLGAAATGALEAVVRKAARGAVAEMDFVEVPEKVGQRDEGAAKVRAGFVSFAGLAAVHNEGGDEACQVRAELGDDGVFIEFKGRNFLLAQD
jgi:hypothetical protein